MPDKNVVKKVLEEIEELKKQLSSYPIDSKECKEWREVHKSCKGCFHENYCRELATKAFIYARALLPVAIYIENVKEKKDKPSKD